MSPRIGVFGGTFDPIHQAHLRMAAAFADELALERVLLIPAGQPYHRARGARASPEQRLEMVRLAIAGDPRLQADDREIRRGRPAYTVETLRELRGELGQDAELWFLMGGDSLATLDSWKDWTQLFQLANLAVAMRPGFDWQTLPAEVRREWQARQVHDFSNRTASGTIRSLALPPLDLSATRLRARLASGQTAEGLIDPAVLAYIRQQRLYQ
ncbi:nicotinate-nucleotide adenylyltransferase [Chromobacterium subtsugae]|uniref:Probable nicotinate-nucleotide adenylyltransferase n=1 Tax=Chromobacterium subtsugae TaxID=251747 RepID=A0ABS7FIM7_9NEIS|nr:MULTISPECIES: nicotinate-nucleotide adenylyltransferase [Chromobacterium]KUM04393.1 nicotinate-nucleotide adenylyltransferase [Chromobacterium subtsugae]KZE87410.1 nicotinate-nicotinamide nucleotide adenylyltransferase [Chromobacterium sp. F49]MBW7566548.1 nicotinate-nucleotide adenylyltransferase [Chromobacterium subtsugae]MBW8289917.1 nicotinate-nucleotide adenylyltransferase [Chromobacterium subtsugae]OBU87303.1 nicotinate-nucleotide adenylyltransferase [Chromobacterium subtsugae]